MSLIENRGKVQLICGPIGNLGDITFRAVECLRRADIIACEDTRHSRRLLSHYEIEFDDLQALHDHNEQQKAEQLVERISESGETMAVISDAGAPSISDPGFRLVRECVAKGLKVEVIPGPSAVITGLVGSGLPTDQFRFRGFLPVKSGKREKLLSEALDEEGTSVFFESPHRIVKTLAALSELDPEREVCVARELTKKFESYHRGSAKEVFGELNDMQAVKGEITLVIAGKQPEEKKPKQNKYRPD